MMKRLLYVGILRIEVGVFSQGIKCQFQMKVYYFLLLMMLMVLMYYFEIEREFGRYGFVWFIFFVLYYDILLRYIYI